MTSVERVIEYSNLEQETQPHAKTVAVPESWPQYGIITFEGLYYTHHHTLPYVLRRLNFCIRAQEKVVGFFVHKIESSNIEQTGVYLFSM